MNQTGPACTLWAFQSEPSVPKLLDWQSRSTVPGAPVAVLDGLAAGLTDGPVATGPLPPPPPPRPAGPAASIPRVTAVPVIPTATTATQAVATRRTWRRCR